MKKTFLLITTTFIFLFMAGCSTHPTTDPYKGLLKKNDASYLAIDGKTIPVDSGMTYQNAVLAYKYPGRLCYGGEREKKVSWEFIQKCPLYVKYDGKKILAEEGVIKVGDSSIYQTIVNTALLFAIVIFAHLFAWTEQYFRKKGAV